jgi:hypothetical protein
MMDDVSTSSFRFPHFWVSILRFSAKSIKCCAPARSPSRRDHISKNVSITGLFEVVQFISFDMWLMNKMNDILECPSSTIHIGIFWNFVTFVTENKLEHYLLSMDHNTGCWHKARNSKRIIGCMSTASWSVQYICMKWSENFVLVQADREPE